MGAGPPPTGLYRNTIQFPNEDEAKVALWKHRFLEGNIGGVSNVDAFWKPQLAHITGSPPVISKSLLIYVLGDFKLTLLDWPRCYGIFRSPNLLYCNSKNCGWYSKPRSKYKKLECRDKLGKNLVWGVQSRIQIFIKTSNDSRLFKMSK